MLNLYTIRPKGFNIGNDVIYIGVNHFIRNAFNEGVNIISLPATSKYESHKKAGLSSSTIYEINQFGQGVIVGGGNLYENDELEVNPTALKALDKPMMIFSVSRGQIYNNKLNLTDRTDVMTDDKIKLLNNKANISLSRDAATYEHIKSLGCDNILGGCPTLFINEMPMHMVPITKSAKTDCLISIRTPNLMSIPVRYQYEFRNQLLEMVQILRKNGYQDIKILCHDHRDIPFAASFSELEYLYTEDVYMFLTYLRSTRLNLTFRLHSFLPCLSFDVPTIKISYDQRAISMLDTIGMSEWNINYLKDNVLTELDHRLKNMNELELLKSDLRESTWPALRKTISDNCDRFASISSN